MAVSSAVSRSLSASMTWGSPFIVSSFRWEKGSGGLDFIGLPRETSLRPNVDDLTSPAPESSRDLGFLHPKPTPPSESDIESHFQSARFLVPMIVCHCR